MALGVIFMGTAELACPSLEALSGSELTQVLAVVTQPDKPKGRDLKIQPSAVKQAALRGGLRVLQPTKAREEPFIEQLRALAPDLIVVAAYGQILPTSILQLPRYGCVNVHASILPKYRGAAPIQWALLNGEPETGVTIMQMDPGLDTGPILRQSATPIGAEDDAQTLHDRLAQMGAELLLRTLPDYVGGRISPRPQPSEGVSHARKITREDGRISWELPAAAIFNRIRAFTPWPGAFTFLAGEPPRRLLKIWKGVVEPGASGVAGEILQANARGLVVACGEQALRVLEIQGEGGRRMSAAEFVAGHRLAAGVSFD